MSYQPSYLPPAYSPRQASYPTSISFSRFNQKFQSHWIENNLLLISNLAIFTIMILALCGVGNGQILGWAGAGCGVLYGASILFLLQKRKCTILDMADTIFRLLITTFTVVGGALTATGSMAIPYFGWGLLGCTALAITYQIITCPARCCNNTTDWIESFENEE